MKFPLATRPFPSLHLGYQDEQTLIDLADLFVRETLADYEAHMQINGGIIDECKWKLLKRHENVLVYQDRAAAEGKGKTHDQIPLEDTTSDPLKLQSLLWFGTIDCDLDDLMYGVVNPTAESAKIKSAYVGNNVLDFALLGTIVEANREDPFRGLQIKWAVNGGPSLMRSMIRFRDFVYLESTGMTTSSTGERIGYHILHSIDIPDIPHLHQYKLVRGNMTLYHLYRQKSPGVVETYVKAFIDVKGDMPASVATMVSAKGVVSVWKVAVCSQMKKLNWMLQSRKASGLISRRHGHHLSQTKCSVCDKDIKNSLSSRKSCQICCQRICSRCCVPKKMCFISPLTREVIQKSMTFCSRCIQTAVQMNGRDVALDEITRDQQHGFYTAVSSSASDPSEYSRTSSNSSMMY